MNNSLYKYKKYFKNKKHYNEWLNIIKDIASSEEFLKRKKMKHHEKHSVYEHSILVSIISFHLAKKFNLNIVNCTLAGLLHDFYTAAWQYSKELEDLDEKYRINFLDEKIKRKFFEKHAFTHGIEAANNAEKYYNEYINEQILSAIRTHMFPLTLVNKEKIPKYTESWIITIADKYVSFKDFPKPKEWLKYIGINKTI